MSPETPASNFAAEYPYSTASLAADLGLATKTVRRRARSLRLGINLDGRAGFRYSEADRRKLIESMRPAVAVKPARKKRAA